MTTIRHAVRSLRSQPALSALIILTLALGIGANTAIFSAVESLLLRDPPRVDPLTFVVAPVVLLLSAGMATYLPARRALRIHPIVALRAD